MNELLYDVNSAEIAGTLFVSMAIAIEIGYRIGRRKSVFANDHLRQHINGIQNSILGILALLLGFTFSLALQRFDMRSDAVVNEANAIGTAYLRTQLLPAPMRPEVRNLMRDYVDLRVREGTLTLADRAGRDALLADVVRAQSRMWDYARKGVEVDPNVYAPALFVEAVNDLIDSFGRHDDALNRHVPEMVLLLLYGTFLLAGTIVGFSAGIAGHRPSLVSHVMIALIVMLAFIIVDLDRPRRGLMQVSQKSLVDLQTFIHADMQPGVPGQNLAR